MEDEKNEEKTQGNEIWQVNLIWTFLLKCFIPNYINLILLKSPLRDVFQYFYRSKVESDTMSYYQLRPLTVLVVHSLFMRLMDILTRSNYRFSNMVVMWQPKVCFVLRTFAPHIVHNFVMPISLSPAFFLVRNTLTFWLTSFSLSSCGYA